jgi:hypothetical protein
MINFCQFLGNPLSTDLGSFAAELSPEIRADKTDMVDRTNAATEAAFVL